MGPPARPGRRLRRLAHFILGFGDNLRADISVERGLAQDWPAHGNYPLESRLEGGRTDSVA